MLRTLLRLPALYPLLAFLAARRVVVRGRSMAPALLPGERVLFDRLAYREAPPRAGDVVLARHPQRPGLRMVKRVAGGPGDTVEAEGREWMLGEGQWLLLGDAPDASTDGRDFGPVGREAILAKGWLVYWPPGRVRVLRPERGEGQP
jgi:signal peptidase I